MKNLIPVIMVTAIVALFVYRETYDANRETDFFEQMRAHHEEAERIQHRLDEWLDRHEECTGHE